jgi:hypothetical protein
MFNFDTILKRNDIVIPDWIYNLILNEWIDESKMTDNEKKNNPNFFVTQGYLKEYEYKKAWRNLWNDTTKEQHEEIRKLPNFDEVIFFDITGIDMKCDIDITKKELLDKANELILKANELKEKANQM